MGDKRAHRRTCVTLCVPWQPLPAMTLGATEILEALCEIETNGEISEAAGIDVCAERAGGQRHDRLPGGLGGGNEVCGGGVGGYTLFPAQGRLEAAEGGVGGEPGGGCVQRARERMLRPAR